MVRIDQGLYTGINYNPGKPNMVVDVLGWLYMGSNTHLDEEKNELEKPLQKTCMLRILNYGFQSRRNRSD